MLFVGIYFISIFVQRGELGGCGRGGVHVCASIYFGYVIASVENHRNIVEITVYTDFIILA